MPSIWCLLVTSRAAPELAFFWFREKKKEGIEKEGKSQRRMPHFLLGSEQMRCPLHTCQPCQTHGLWGVGGEKCHPAISSSEVRVKGMDEVWVWCLWVEPWPVDLQISWSVGMMSREGRGDHGGTPVPHPSSYLACLQ